MAIRLGRTERGGTDMRELDALHPINRVAARVVFGKNDNYIPAKKINAPDQDFPHPMYKNLSEFLKDPNWRDLTGIRFGRFTTIGKSIEFNGRWVVRCDCGVYSIRRGKSILNPENSQDRCDLCRHLVFLKREEHYRYTGKDLDIRSMG